MPNYLRPKVTGSTVFFTVALARRGDDLLVREVDRLREAVRVTMQGRPFAIEAWVVLPDHLHAVWTLPEGDRDYSTRWGAIKARFSMDMRRAGFTPPPPIGFSNGGVRRTGVWADKGALKRGLRLASRVVKNRSYSVRSADGATQ